MTFCTGLRPLLASVHTVEALIRHQRFRRWNDFLLLSPAGFGRITSSTEEIGQAGMRVIS